MSVTVIDTGVNTPKKRRHRIRVRNHVIQNILGSLFGASAIAALSTLSLFASIIAIGSLIGMIMADRVDIEEEEELSDEAKIS